MNFVFGVLYLVVGLGLTTTLVSRLYVYWEGFERAQKTLLLGLMFIMFGFTQRGIALLWFNGPDVTPAAYLAMTGAIACLVALLLPVDKRLEPESWKSRMKTEDPALYDKYIDVLNRSAANRQIGTSHADKYLTEYRESD